MPRLIVSLAVSGLSLGLLLLASACGPQVAPIPPAPTLTPTATATPTPGAATPTRVEEAGEMPASFANAAIVHERSGGFAGIQESWAIFLDGTVLSRDGKKGQLPPAEVSDLLRQIEAAGFFGWQQAYLPSTLCCDRFTYRLTVRLGDRTKTVSTMDGALGEPPSLQPLLRQVYQTVTKVKTK